MDSLPIGLTFRYSERDYVRALRSHYASHLRLWLDVFLIAVFVVLGVYVWFLPGLLWLSICCFGVSGIFALTLIAAFFIIPPLVFRREPKFRDEYSITFSPECIHFNTAHIDSRLQWDLYSRALVDRHSYVLYHGTRSFTVIPKRTFQSSEQQETFEKLLTERIATIVRKK